jgi:hypothetical protein
LIAEKLLPSFASRPSGENSARDWVQYLKQLSPNQRESLLAECERIAGNLPNAKSFKLMSEDQIRLLASQGHEIGSHTISHPLLPQLDLSSQTCEIFESREHLGEILDQKPEGFCYPNGDKDERVFELVREAGYRYACTTEYGLNQSGVEMMNLKRLDMNPQRVARRDGSLDTRAFTGELCGYREKLRCMQANLRNLAVSRT